MCDRRFDMWFLINSRCPHCDTLHHTHVALSLTVSYMPFRTLPRAKRIPVRSLVHPSSMTVSACGDACPEGDALTASPSLCSDVRVGDASAEGQTGSVRGTSAFQWTLNHVQGFSHSRANTIKSATFIMKIFLNSACGGLQAYIFAASRLLLTLDIQMHRCAPRSSQYERDHSRVGSPCVGPVLLLLSAYNIVSKLRIWQLCIYFFVTMCYFRKYLRSDI